MNEIIVTTKTTEIIAGFKNVELKETTTNAMSQALSIENNRKNIAVALAKVFNNDLWNEDFENFDTYAETIYGLNRTTVSRLRRISDRFITNVNSPLDSNYTINQMAEILPLEDDEISNGEFYPDMGIKDIRKEVQRIKALRLETEETEETEETDETEETEEIRKSVKLERTFENKKELSVWLQEMFTTQANMKNIKITYEL